MSLDFTSLSAVAHMFVVFLTCCGLPSISYQFGGEIMTSLSFRLTLHLLTKLFVHILLEKVLRLCSFLTSPPEISV